MAPIKAAKPAPTVSQQAFDEMVQENIDDLGMDPAESLEDALQTLTLQGVDLSGIVTCLPEEINPVVDCLRKLKEEKEIVKFLDELNVLCRDNGSGNAVIAAKNGAVELLISICLKLREECDQGVVSALNVLASVIHDLQCTEIFRENGGPNVVVGILSNEKEDLKLLDCCYGTWDWITITPEPQNPLFSLPRSSLQQQASAVTRKSQLVLCCNSSFLH